MQNKLNLELKYFCPDFLPIRQVLLEIGAKKYRTTRQKDYFFNLPNFKQNARLKLRIENQKQTLIYYGREDFKEDKANPAKIILYPIKDNKFLMFLSNTLGVRAIVVKKREQWKKGNAVFNLDTVEKVGKIFEIEVTTDQKNLKKDEDTFNNYKEKVLAYLSKVVKGSNLDLVSKVK